MKLIKEKKRNNLDAFISLSLLKQFAKSHDLTLNIHRRAQVLYMQELYTDYIMKKNLN